MACPSNQAFAYTLGEKVELSVALDPPGTAELDFSLDEVTVNFDSQADGTRFTFRYRPVGTADNDNEYFELIGQELYFKLPSAWTAENCTVGRWEMSFSAFDPATEQDEVSVVYIDFTSRAGGVLPVT